MNKTRRSAITAAGASLPDAGVFDDAKTALEALRDEEQEAYDNMPDGLRDGERGDAAQAAIDALENAMEKLDDIIAVLDEIGSYLETAVE